MGQYLVNIIQLLMVSFMSPKITSGVVSNDSWTGQPIMVPRYFCCLCIQPMKYVNRKVMLYPIVSPRQTQYLVIDKDGPVNMSAAHIPYFKLKDNTLVHVVNVTISKDQFLGYTLKKISGRNKRWMHQSKEPTMFSFLDVVNSVDYEKYLHGFKINII